MLTERPNCMTPEQHQQAESEGWSIFWYNGMARVERIDELELLASDMEAIALAQKMGLNVDSTGFLCDELQVTFG